MDDNNTFQPGPLADVRCHMQDGRPTLVMVRHLRHSPSKVWSALTDPAQLRQWAPFTPDRDLGRLGDATLAMTDGQDTTFPATVRRCEPPTLLEYTWGDGVLRCELEAVAHGTRLTLHHTVDDMTSVAKVAAGWHMCLVVAEHLLDGQPIGPIVGENAINFGWQALHDGYAEKLAL